MFCINILLLVVKLTRSKRTILSTVKTFARFLLCPYSISRTFAMNPQKICI